MAYKSCTPNQKQANCFELDNGSCVQSCSNITDTGCSNVKMWGAVKICPTWPLPHPRVYEGYKYIVPDSPDNISKLSYGALGASRDAGLLYLPGKMSLSSNGKRIAGLVLVISAVLILALLIYWKMKKCSTCVY